MKCPTLEDCINAYRIKITGLNDLINIIKKGARIIPIKFGNTKSNFLIILLILFFDKNIINEKII